jgi:hypothetical protein
VLLRYPYEVRSADEYFDDIQDVKVTKDTGNWLWSDAGMDAFAYRDGFGTLRDAARCNG